MASQIRDVSGQRTEKGCPGCCRIRFLLESSDVNNPEVEDSFQKAIDIARAQNARGWELRAATALARLRLEQNRSAEAHQLLAPVFAWFTEGFETIDLREAKALLDELSLSACL